MGEIHMTRDFYLWSMSVIYLFAFSSLFVQIPGLYGDNGILPAKLVAPKEAESLQDLVENQPGLLRLMPKLGLSVETGMDLLCIGGTILSLCAMTSRRLRNSATFFFLWALYLSLFQVGQTFLWFQWDILLLEAGFLTIFVAPLNILCRHRIGFFQHDRITFWLLKWLLFRLMFASGVVKLTSNCPTWWGLTALNYHFETQCIPQPAAWIFHQFPEWFQSFSVAMTLIIEIGLPFMFFSPVRQHRIFAFYGQILLQLLIIITGNYNFFNLLTVTLCLSLIDDNFIRNWLKKPLRPDEDSPDKLPVIGKFWRLIAIALNLTAYGALVYWSVVLFDMKLVRKPSMHIEAKITFSSQEFTTWLATVVPITIWMGLLSLLWELFKGVVRSLVHEKGSFKKVRNFMGCALFGAFALGLFSVSLVPHAQISKEVRQSLPNRVKLVYGYARPFKLASPYGLFRRMTGVGGRPEVIIEGSNSMDRGWREYEFLYKPGNVTYKLPVVAPHQPRLDWQMWFAALGTYQHNPWFLNLCYRLLNNEPWVLGLMGKNPFPDKPPKYIRATLYHYHFTSWHKDNERYSDFDWWTRERVKEYLPIVTKNEPSFINYLTQAGIIQANNEESIEEVNVLEKLLRMFRKIIGQPEGFAFTMALFVIGLVMTFLDPNVKVIEWPEV